MYLSYLTTCAFLILQFHILLADFCRMSNDHKTYTCTGLRFNKNGISKGNRQQLLQLQLYDCKQTEITDDLLVFPNVENLTMSCGIHSIHMNAFKDINNLQELDLGTNILSALPEHVFEALEQLKTLNLTRNVFEQLTKNMFKGLHTLKRLFMSYNIISEINMETLHNTQELEEIHLDHNKISFIPVKFFSKTTKLQYVDLNHNNIKNLGAVFTSTYKLVHLNLSCNVIQHIADEIFQVTPIKILDLSNNKLITIGEHLLVESLEELYLQNNQISLFDINDRGPNKIALNYLNVENNRLVFLHDDFIKKAANLVTLKVEGNPWDCKCYENIEKLRGNLNLTLDASLGYQEGEEPLCVVGNLSECNFNAINVMYYYNILQKQRDL